MTLAVVYSRAACGMRAPLVTIETHLSAGMAGFCIVGLPETAVKESRDRIRSAFINAQLEFPIRRITVNLAPADLPKEGSCFDLPIALGIMAVAGYIPVESLLPYEFTGELALSGQLRPVSGVLPMVLSAYDANRSLIVPAQNAEEAALFPKAEARSAEHLLDVYLHLKGERLLSSCQREERTACSRQIDMSDVQGQAAAKRALEIAAAGRHSLLFVGPPGTGKTMLASRLVTIMPPLSDDESIEAATIASVSRQGFCTQRWRQIPYRAPHHSSSMAALVGGGRPPKPGEISLAHNGVLFLDELPEFSRHVLESLREPLESGMVTISRAGMSAHFPARFQLVAAMNPCPCGYAGSLLKACQCSHEQVKRYIAKLSGPFLDRVDMQVTVSHLPLSLLGGEQCAESSDVILQRVVAARQRQHDRQQITNAALTAGNIAHYCTLDNEAEACLQRMANQYHFSARAYHRILKVARTIADLAASATILVEHVSEAFTYRRLEAFC